MKSVSLEKATETHGKVMKDGQDTYKSLLDSDIVFVWDWKLLQRVGEKWFENLDKMLVPLGAQVVKVKFDGDCIPWYIEKI